MIKINISITEGNLPEVFEFDDYSDARDFFEARIVKSTIETETVFKYMGENYTKGEMVEVALRAEPQESDWVVRPLAYIYIDSSRELPVIQTRGKATYVADECYKRFNWNNIRKIKKS